MNNKIDQITVKLGDQEINIFYYKDFLDYFKEYYNASDIDNGYFMAMSVVESGKLDKAKSELLNKKTITSFLDPNNNSIHLYILPLSSLEHIQDEISFRIGQVCKPPFGKERWWWSLKKEVDKANYFKEFVNLSIKLSNYFQVLNQQI